MCSRLILISIFFIWTSVTNASTTSQPPLPLSPCEKAILQPMNVWLPISIFGFDHTQPVEGYLLNPVTREKRYLPVGWMFSDFLAISEDQPWTTIMKPGPNYENQYNLINFITGELLFEGADENLKPIDRVVNDRLVVEDKVTNRYAWIDLKTRRKTYFSDRVQSLSTKFANGYWSALDHDYKPLYITEEGQIHKPKLPSGLTQSTFKIVRADSFSESRALAAIGKNVGYDPERKFGFLAPDLTWAIDPRFEEAHGFSNGRAWVRHGGLWGVINKEGEWLVEPKFMIPSLIDSREFIVSSTRLQDVKVYSGAGEYLFDLPDDARVGTATYFVRDGVVQLGRTGGQYGFFDLRERRWLGEFSYNPTTQFINGYVQVEIIGEGSGVFNPFGEGYINRNGELVAFIPRLGQPEEILPKVFWEGILQLPKP